MVNRAIIIALCVALSIAAYHAYWDDTAYLSINNTALEKLADKLQDYQHNEQEKWRQILAEQAEHKQLLASLNEQIKLLNTGGKIHSRMQEENMGVNKTHNDEPKMLTELEVGQYMDHVLLDNTLDEDITESKRIQTHEILKQLPGVLLDDMRCGESFCRAKFVRVDGKQPDIDNIWGTPPFMYEGFSIIQADGSVLLYFTEAHGTLDSFRELAANEN